MTELVRKETNPAPMTFAYADPPYLGCCRLYDHPDQDGCWDDPSTHRRLLERLVDEYPDGWALSASAPSIWTLAAMVPPDARMAPWNKSFGAFKRGVRPAYMWEPVIFWRGRNPGTGHPHPPPEKGGKQTTPKDFLWETDELPENFLWENAEPLLESITLRKGLTGAKPPRFCRWVLELLGYVQGDQVVDVFPGTGVMGDVLAQGRLAV